MDEAWREFLVTGKVTDYLKYRESDYAQTAGSLQKERPDGTEHCSDRDGLKCDADWRL